MLKITNDQLYQMMTSRPIVSERQIGYELYHTAFESVIDQQICRGTIKSLVIRPGITLLQTDLVFFQDTEIEMRSTEPQVGFCFCLKGNTTAYVRSQYDGRGDDGINMDDRTVIVYANASSDGPQHFWANQPIKILYVHFSFQSFKGFMGNLVDLPEGLVAVLEGKKTSYLYLSKLVQPTISLCYSLYDIPFQGKSREFFIEARVIELIAYLVDELLKASIDVRLDISPKLTKAERVTLELCYSEIEQNLASPPSLIELAKKYGLTVYRLKNAFRYLYGETPFKVLTELRMKKAKELLEESDFNVGEVAIKVGYSSLGTFSNTFKERFGMRPRALKS